MKRVQNAGVRFIVVFLMLLGFSNFLTAGTCSNKLFSVTIDSKLTIGDVIENLAETCALTVIVKDDAAKQRMNKKLYYVKLKNSTLTGFLNTILKDHDLHYTLSGNKLKISYLITRTFRIHYISGQRIGKSQANVTIADSSNSLDSVGGAGAGGTSSGSGDASKTGISIESNDEFRFWKTVESEVQRVLIGAGDGSTHYAKTGEGWTGPDGRVWEYNPLAPIVNPEAGMVTVTGTSRQINRVARYVHTLTKQIKQQVLIDVRILTVAFDDSSTTGVDWEQLYSLQNFTVNSLLQTQQNINAFEFSPAPLGIGSYEYGQGGKQSGANLLSLTGSVEVKDVVKFLNTQGDVKAISSPRVMTLNNQPALISVGKELFYKLKSSATGSGGSGVGGGGVAEGETVDSVFAGILLDITPEIDANGMITLKINPSISDTIDDIESASVAGFPRDIPPDLIRRQIASVIKVRDGQHAILGGLIFSRTGTKINKIPLLGDLPLLEYAFKHEEKINKVEELVMIVTPHIIKNSKSVSLKDLGYTKLNEK